MGRPKCNKTEHKRFKIIGNKNVVTNFTYVSLGFLVPILGIKKNHKNHVPQLVEMVDMEATGCVECGFFNGTCSEDICNSVCTKKVMKIDPEKTGCTTCPHYAGGCCTRPENKAGNCTKTVYVNEKAKYGTKKPMYANAIKVFLNLLFMHPDKKGNIPDVHIDELAETIGISKRTTINALKELQNAAYIKTSNTINGKRNITILGWEYTTCTADKGGTGYITISKQLMEELNNIEHVNTLRSTLRAYTELDKGNAYSDHANTVTRTFKDIAREMPKSMRIGALIESVKASSIFNFKVNKADNTIRFSIKDEYFGKRQKRKTMGDMQHKLNEFVTEFNDMTLIHNKFVKRDDERRTSLETFSSLGKNRYKGVLSTDLYKNHYQAFFENIGKDGNFAAYMPPLALKREVMDDLTNLACAYSLEEIKVALKEIYQSLLSKGEEPKHYGALVRSIIIRNKSLSNEEVYANPA